MSARRYWSFDQLWQDWHYWRDRAQFWRRFSGMSVSVEAHRADANAVASMGVLTRRRPGLASPDIAAAYYVEGYGGWERDQRATR